MSSEPERPIEKLLRTAAKERREQAGASWEIHPAERRLLQMEVAQRFGSKKASPARTLVGWLFGPWWLRAMAGLAVLALLGLAVWSTIPGLAPRKSEALLARNDQTPSPIVSPSPRSIVNDKPALNELLPNHRDELATGLSVNNVTGAKQEASLELSRRGLSTGKDAAPELPVKEAEADALSSPGTQIASQASSASGTVSAEQAATGQGRALGQRYGYSNASEPAQSGAPASAPVSLGVARSKGQSITDNAPSQPIVVPGLAARAAPSLKLGDLAVATPSKAPTPESVEYGYFAATQTPAPQQALVQRAREQGLNAGTKTLAAEIAQAPAQILVSFRVEQSGRELRVIDSDNSVYSGPVQAIAPVAAAEEQRSRSASISRSAKRQNDPSSSNAASAQQNAGARWLFQVVGTNRSSNQRVLFSGTLSGITNLSDSSLANQQGRADFGGAVQAVEAQSNNLSRNMQISGKAVIGQGAEVQIEAVPAPIQQPLR